LFFVADEDEAVARLGSWKLSRLPLMYIKLTKSYRPQLSCLPGNRIFI